LGVDGFFLPAVLHIKPIFFNSRQYMPAFMPKITSCLVRNLGDECRERSHKVSCPLPIRDLERDSLTGVEGVRRCSHGLESERPARPIGAVAGRCPLLGPRERRTGRQTRSLLAAVIDLVDPVLGAPSAIGFERLGASPMTMSLDRHLRPLPGRATSPCPGWRCRPRPRRRPW